MSPPDLHFERLGVGLEADAGHAGGDVEMDERRTQEFQATPLAVSPPITRSPPLARVALRRPSPSRTAPRRDERRESERACRGRDTGASGETRRVTGSTRSYRETSGFPQGAALPARNADVATRSSPVAPPGALSP